MPRAESALKLVTAELDAWHLLDDSRLGHRSPPSSQRAARSVP
jgi:hypothetical protein